MIVVAKSKDSKKVQEITELIRTTFTFIFSVLNNLHITSYKFKMYHIMICIRTYCGMIITVNLVNIPITSQLQFFFCFENF